MNRIKLALIAGGALIAAPAFADDQAEPAAGGTVEAGGEAQVPAGGAGAGMDATATAGGHTMAWPKEIMDRPLTVLKGKLGAGADVVIAHSSFTFMGTTTSSTNEGLQLVGAYGISDKLEVGGSYAFALNEFEIKGPLALFGNFNLTNDGKLAVGAGAALVLNFNGTDPMMPMNSATNVAIDAGLGVRFKLAPKFAVFTGNPFGLAGTTPLGLLPSTPGLVGSHLHLGLSGDESKSFAIPVGFAMQATPELFAYVSTNVATILISDPGMGDRVSLISDFTPLSLGGWYAATANIDAGLSLNFIDLQNAGDFWAIAIGARYFN